MRKKNGKEERKKMKKKNETFPSYKKKSFLAELMRVQRTVNGQPATNCTSTTPTYTPMHQTTRARDFRVVVALKDALGPSPFIFFFIIYYSIVDDFSFFLANFLFLLMANSYVGIQMRYSTNISLNFICIIHCSSSHVYAKPQKWNGFIIMKKEKVGRYLSSQKVIPGYINVHDCKRDAAGGKSTASAHLIMDDHHNQRMCSVSLQTTTQKTSQFVIIISACMHNFFFFPVYFYFFCVYIFQ